jgi:hypothetical protein
MKTIMASQNDFIFTAASYERPGFESSKPT